MADYQRLITTEDIQRRYNLQGLESERKIIQTLNNNLTKTFGIIKNYIACTTSLESKEQYFLSGVPTLENYPYTEWEDPEDHLNSVYYDTDGGKVYIFKYNSQDEYYYWEESTDSSLLNAMSVANSQADVSEDNLRRVFYEQPTVPYNVGDIWINGSKIYRCMRNETAESEFYQDDWIDYLQYNDSVATSNALRILGEFKETVETEYVTKTLLETTTDTITAEVSRVQTFAEGKSATYTEQPTPPYYKGDTYIKEVTDSETGITMNLIYVCQYSRLEGTYHEEDFSLQPGYATLSQLKVTNDSVTSTVAKVDGQDAKISQVQQSVNEINAKIQDIANITVTETTENGFMTITGVNTSEPIEITIIPRIDDIAYLYPKSALYPSNSLFSKQRKLEFHNTYDDTYYYLDVPDNLWYLNSEVYDEFVLHYGDGTQADPQYFEVIKRVGINSNGEKYALANEEVIPYPYQHINLTDGEYDITLLGYTRAYMKITLMASNLYTTQFATKVELNTAISVTSEHFNVEVSKKVGKTEVISSINQTAEAVKIQAGKIDIAGTITAINNNTSTTINGNKITTGSIDTAQLKANAITADKIATNAITANKISAGTITADKIANATITGSKLVNGTITGTQIADSTITGGKIANATITGGKIASATISASNIVDGTITNAKIAGGAITGAKIADGTITGAKISGGTITNVQISDSTITNSKIANGAVNNDKVASGSITSSRINTSNFIISNSRGAIDLKDGILRCFNSSGGSMILSNAVRLSATAGAVISSNSNGNISAPSKNIDLKACSGASVYLGSMTNAGGTSEGSGFSVNRSSIIASRSITISSDKRKKKNIEKLEDISWIDDLIIKEFDYKSGGKSRNIGLIAQDYENKEYNKYFLETDEEGYYAISYGNITNALIKYCQELKKRINELEENYGKTINN